MWPQIRRTDIAASILILLAVNFVLIVVSTSLSYELKGDWREVSNLDEAYNKQGWKTYTMKTTSISEVKILQDGLFNFAWKMNHLGDQNKLYFKDEPFFNSTDFKETDYYNVKKNEILKWMFSTANWDGGQVWIAFPCNVETQRINQTPVINQTLNQTFERNQTQEIIKRRYLNNNNLQDMIDTYGNNTDIILNRPICIINQTINIYNKRNLNITSDVGQTEINGWGIQKIISIKNSSYLNITKLKLLNSTNGIEIINCDHTNISNNEIVFAFPGEGLSVLYGSFNIISGNYLHNVSASCSSNETSVGINLTSTWNNQIIKNIIYSMNPTANICHYAIVDSCNKGNIIVFSAPLESLLVVQDLCYCFWNTTIMDFGCKVNSDHDSLDSFCMIQDHKRDDPMIWEP